MESSEEASIKIIEFTELEIYKISDVGFLIVEVPTSKIRNPK
jgi:hypothetical protein